MEQILIEINCPDCGFNHYSAKNIKSNEIVELTVGKCNATECDLTISNSSGTEYQTYPDLQELRAFVNLNFDILSKNECGCSN